MDPNEHPPRRPLRALSDRDPFDVMLAGISEERVDQAALARSRQRWVRQQAAESSSLAGLFTDAAESRYPLDLTLCDAHRLQATVTAVGADFVAVASTGAPAWHNWLLPARSIIAVRAAGSQKLPTGDRTTTGYRASFVDAVALLAGQRLEVLVGATGNEPLRAELDSVGLDLLRLRDDSRRDVAVPLASVTWLRV